jgi:ribosome silencing factor RsfS/YbeB/iojap
LTTPTKRVTARKAANPNKAGSQRAGKPTTNTVRSRAAAAGDARSGTASARKATRPATTAVRAPRKVASGSRAKPASGKPAAKKVTSKQAASGTRPSRGTASRKPASAAPAKTPRTAARRGKPKRELDVVEQLQQSVMRALDDMKARDVNAIDVRDKTSVADTLVVASGTSSRHVKSIADEVVRQAKRLGLPPIGVEGEREGEWVLVDLGDVIVHIMLPRTREFYGLERLWTVGDDEPAFADAG